MKNDVLDTISASDSVARIMKHAISTSLLLLSLAFAAACGEDSAPVEDSIGKSCTADSQCPEALFCSKDSPTDVCAGTCRSSADCTAAYGPGFGCVNGNTRCARVCTSDAQCPSAECVPFTSGTSYCSNQ